MFPPATAARSTTTDPGFMLSIMYFLIRRGARLPGRKVSWIREGPGKILTC